MLFILASCEILSDSGTVQLSGSCLLVIVAVGVLRKGVFFNIPVQLDVSFSLAMCLKSNKTAETAPGYSTTGLIVSQAFMA